MTGPDQLVLFTGFPGFIGARLLPRLLELKREWSFRCLVQPKFLDTARKDVARIESSHPFAKDRIGLVEGDITEPGLGLDAAQAQSLRAGVVSAYHLAAVYDLAVALELGHRVNVLGTRNVLEFLKTAPRLDRLHYVSTAYVSGRTIGVFRETDLDLGQSFKNHYESTKFQAEVDVVRSGLPHTIYRPGVVVGDSRTGETGKFDGPYFVLNAMTRLPSPGLFIKVGSGTNPVNVVPVDFVVEALARLSTSEVSHGKTYHLTDPEPLSAYDVGELFARCLGKSFAYVRVPTPLARALFSPRPVQRYFGMPAESLDYFDHPCRHDATVATRDLAGLGIRCPRLPEYAPRLVEFFKARNGSVRREAMV